jgi:hypothetical protein
MVAPVRTISADFGPYYGTTINRGLCLRKALQRSRICEQRVIPGGVLIQQQLKTERFARLTPDLLVTTCLI